MSDFTNRAMLAAAAALVLPLAAAPVSAQGGAAMGGPVVPNVCMLSREAVIANTKVGVFAANRVKQLADQAQAEIEADKRPVDVEAQAFRANAAKMTPEQREAQQRAINAKYAPIQAKAELRQREIDRTRAKAIDAIGVQVQPAINAAYTAKNCGLLIDRNSVLGGNMANDLTAAVVAAVDAKIQTMDIQRENLSGQPATPGQR